MEEATEFTEQDFNAVLARMRGTAAPWRQIILACNPDAPTHWINTRLIMGNQATVYYSGAVDNTHNPEDYLDTLNQLTGIEKQRLVLGKWVMATGVIYDNWSEEDNVTTEAEYIPGGGELFWGIDDGYAGEVDPVTGYPKGTAHPRVIGLYQLRPNGRLCKFDESWALRTQPDIHINDVIDLGYPLPDYVCIDKSAAQLKALIREEYGLPTFNSPQSVEESIKIVRQFIAPDKNGWRQLLVHPRCKLTRSEMVSYRRDDNGRVIKQFDHALDELRYTVWGVFKYFKL